MRPHTEHAGRSRKTRRLGATREGSSDDSHTVGATVQVQGLTLTDHTFVVPLDHTGATPVRSPVVQPAPSRTMVWRGGVGEDTFLHEHAGRALPGQAAAMHMSSWALLCSLLTRAERGGRAGHDQRVRSRGGGHQPSGRRQQAASVGVLHRRSRLRVAAPGTSHCVVCSSVGLCASDHLQTPARVAPP